MPTAKSSSLYTREPFTPPYGIPLCSHTAFFERGARIEIESDGEFGKEDKSGEQKLVARVSPRSEARNGDPITVAIDTERMHIFDKDTEKCICH